MGPTRTVRRVHERYANTPQSTHVSGYYTMRKWAARYDWQKRAEEYDAQIDAAKTTRAQEIMRSGLALDHERVHGLKQVTASWQIQ